MGYRPTRRDIVTVGFVPFKGYEIGKRRPASVMGKDSYNISVNLAIVCSITSLDKERPFLVSIYSEKPYVSDNAISKVNTLQIYSLGYIEQAQRRMRYIDMSDEETFYEVAQKFLQDFSFAV